MGKTCYVPTDVNFDPSWIDIGTVEIINATTLNISTVTTNAVKNILGESTNDIGQLCQSQNVNRWSLFCPPGDAPYHLGDFAGYDHQALPCVYYFPRDGNSKQKQYDSVAGDAKFPVQLSLLIGQKYPLHSGSNSSWAEIAVKVVVGAVTQWTTLSLPADNYISLWFHTPGFDAETITAAVSAYYVDDPGGISLVGYKDGHYKGVLIEDDEINFNVQCAAIDSTLYCNYTYTIHYDSSKRWVSIQDLSPAGYSYAFTPWAASQGTINQNFGTYAEVGLVNDGGTPNCGIFHVGVTASYTNMISVYQYITITIRNNQYLIE